MSFKARPKKKGPMRIILTQSAAREIYDELAAGWITSTALELFVRELGEKL